MRALSTKLEKMPRSFASPSSYNIKGYAGVCCITTYVSKRKKELTFRGGWYVYLHFHDVIFLQNVRTCSKRKFFLMFRNVSCYTTDPRLDIQKVNVIRCKVILLVRSTFIGHNRGPYIRDALYSMAERVRSYVASATQW